MNSEPSHKASQHLVPVWLSESNKTNTKFCSKDEMRTWILKSFLHVNAIISNMIPHSAIDTD